MIASMAQFYPAIHDLYKVERRMISIRDAIKWRGYPAGDISREGDRALRVRAGKIDAIIHAEAEVRRLLGQDNVRQIAAA